MTSTPILYCWPTSRPIYPSVLVEVILRQSIYSHIYHISKRFIIVTLIKFNRFTVFHILQSNLAVKVTYTPISASIPRSRPICPSVLYEATIKTLHILTTLSHMIYHYYFN